MQSENHIYYPQKLTGEELDAFLEMGWYRMGLSIFTTDFILLQEQVRRVFWLRYDLNKLELTQTQRRIKVKNKQFDVSVKPLELNKELEDLYSIYKTDIDFQGANSVHEWLNGELQSQNVFNSKLFEIRDNGKLIAAGIADWGTKTIAGIMNFFHPDYRKYSLGKYLMILKIEQAKLNKMQWYYPGYIVYGCKRFDYKLSVDEGAIEILIPELENWLPYNNELVEQYGISI